MHRFQPPGVLHCVYTPVPSLFVGGYFYHYETMHLTRATLSIGSINDEDSLTNDERPGFIRTLSRMIIALRYRSESRKCLNQVIFPRYLHLRLCNRNNR